VNELNFLFHSVGQYCQREVITAKPDDPLVDAAAVMLEHGISGLVICSAGAPIGIVTDRDLRNKVIAKGRDLRAMTIREIMSTPLITVTEDEFLFEALLRLARHKIHRLVVTGSAGALVGIITADDIRMFQNSLPQQLIRSIEEASDAEALKIIHQRVQQLAIQLVDSNMPVQDLIRLIGRLNDRILLRVLQMVHVRYPELSGRFAFVVLGSQGRGEQTLTTDQDTALIHAENLTVAELQHLAGFCREVIDTAVTIGIPYCPGDTMASNEFWRRSSSDWRREIDGWFSTITLDNIINVAMFSDMRTLYGDQALEQEIKAHIASCLGQNELFLMKMAANVNRISIPLGWSGRIKTETCGKLQGQLDIKRGGIFTITEGVKVLALEAKILDGGTLQRIDGLVEAGVLSGMEAENLRAAFDQLIAFRLRFQVAALREGNPPDNYIIPELLNRMDKGKLRLALEEVRFFQALLKRHYQLELMP